MTRPSVEHRAIDRLRRSATGAFDRGSALAILIYIATALLFFGRGLAGHFTDFHVGRYMGDPAQCIWSLAWLPHALAHGRNPVFSDAVWAPEGINLTWTMWLPLEALIAWPITAIEGPIASYNLLALASLPLGAWSAFILCRHLSGSWWAAVVGGGIFGFSGYMLYYLWTGDLNLIAVFPIPLAVYVVVRAYQGEIGGRALIGWLTALLVTIFALFTELFATATMFGVIAVVLAFIVMRNDERERLRAILPAILTSYALALIVLSPYLYYIFAASLPNAPIWPARLYAADLAFFLLPSNASALGQLSLFQKAASAIPNSPYVGYCYLGPVLLVVVAAFALHRRRETRDRLLIALFGAVALLSLGPALTVCGRSLLPMPGILLNLLPLMRNALAARFTMYLNLIVALITSLWLADRAISRVARCTTAGLAVLFVLPSFSAAYWDTPADTPPFFTDHDYRRYMAPGEIALVAPYGWSGNSMLWQAQSDMYFRMAGGYTGMPPARFQRWPAMIALFNGTWLPDAQMQLKAFMAAHDVTVALVDQSARDSSDPKQRQNYQTIVSALGPASAEDGGMLIYRFAPTALAPWRNLDPLELERRVDQARFSALLDAVDRYVAGGGDLIALSPERLKRAGLIRGNWIAGPNIIVSEGLWARARPDGKIELGTFGSRGALLSLRIAFGHEALDVVETPIVAAGGVSRDGQLELIVMTFDRASLARAADRVRALAQTDGNAPTAANGRQNHPR